MKDIPILDGAIGPTLDYLAGKGDEVTAASFIPGIGKINSVQNRKSVISNIEPTPVLYEHDPNAVLWSQKNNNISTKPTIIQFSGKQIITDNNISNILSRLKENNNGAFVLRSRITPKYAILEKLPEDFDKDIVSISNTLHQNYRGITPTYQTLLFTEPGKFSGGFKKNLQLQKAASGNYLYKNDFSSLTNEAIEEAKETLNAGFKNHLWFDFRGPNNSLYDPITNKFSFIDMNSKPQYYSSINPVMDFNNQLLSGISKSVSESRTKNSAIDFIREKGLKSLKYEEGGKIN